jgi:KaiC/GvpD/RAD55 family RecA-like ATPase
MVLQAEALPKIVLSITDVAGEASTIFPENNTSTTTLMAKVSVEDPFRGTNIKTVLLTVTNSTAYSLIKDAQMNLTSRAEQPFHLDYALSIAIPAGRFNVTVSVRDAAERNFLISKEVAVTHFYTLALLLVDAQQRVLSGLNVSASAWGQLVEEVPTNATGWARMQVPSSQAVGPLVLRVRNNGLVILSRGIDVGSDSLIRLEAPLYDWTLFVRLQSLGTPIFAARVDLRLNDTFVASATTDANGAAYFRAVPLGQYEVTVTYLLMFKRFVNVTHMSGPKETIMELPIISISDVTALLLAGIVIVAVVGVYASSRRKRRRSKHVEEFLGDAVLEPAVVMIVGPSGSGKSLLLQNLLADLLRHERRCVYVSNSELPSKVRERLAKMGLDAHKFLDSNMLRFVDAYSGTTGAISSEKYSVPSPRDLTRLGIQLTSCLEELGEPGDVFFDSLTPVVGPGALERGFDFIQYYGARTKNSGGTFLYVASTTIDPELLARLEELSDCVLQTEKYPGRGGIRGRLLVKKARDVAHEQGWVGFRIRSNGRMEFVSLPPEAP